MSLTRHLTLLLMQLLLLLLLTLSLMLHHHHHHHHHMQNFLNYVIVSAGIVAMKVHIMSKYQPKRSMSFLSEN